jgi:hypothetical protein
VDRKIIIKRLRRNRDWTGFIWLGLGTSGGNFEQGNEILGTKLANAVN